MTPRFRFFFALLAATVAVLFIAEPAMAQQVNINLGDNATLTGRIVQLVALVTVLSLAPSILIVVTSFTRIIVVLSLLRSALGIQQTPPNTVLISLALFLTAFIMAPTFTKAYNEGVAPFMSEQIEASDAFQKTVDPFKEFMLAHVRDKDLKLFLDMSKSPPPATAMDTPLQVVIPAFLIGELSRAFEIGFLLFVPFVVIDMVIASVLMSMGMMMLPPVMISLPFKLIFFVLVDGWSLVAGSLVKGFGVT
jgi:flagellar biosynthetic protein FliP